MRQNLSVSKIYLGKKLKILREIHGLTQNEVAYMLGINRSTYTYYESEKTQPSLEMLRRLALLFDVSSDFLLDLPEKNTEIQRRAQSILLIDSTKPNTNRT